MTIYKTSVRKYGGRWRVEYYYPFSGEMYVDRLTWREAMDEAVHIEKEKQWV